MDRIDELRLSVKKEHQEFIRAIVVEHLNPKEAYRRTYPRANDHTAGNRASELMQREDIQELMELEVARVRDYAELELMEAGWDYTERMALCRDMAMDDSQPIVGRLGAIKLYNDMEAALKPSEGDTGAGVSSLAQKLRS